MDSPIGSAGVRLRGFFEDRGVSLVASMSTLPKGFVTASHTDLFAEPASPRCDVCHGELGAEDDDAEGHQVSGRGLLVWTRGEERRYQEPPLCPSCASAIGLTALQRWEIEEDEG
jgi:hypothetical protein